MTLPVGEIVCGDCLDVMRGWPDGCIDAVITDPPYGLRFMGAKWDYDVPSVETWREVHRVLRDGGRLLAFSGARTQHRMVCNIEDAGFCIEDCIMWIYGSGFPKHGSKLKPAYEPICVARKGSVSLLNIDAARIEHDEPEKHTQRTMPRFNDRAGYRQDDEPNPATIASANPAGRWPANICLDEWLEPVLCLGYNVDDGIQTAIKAYFQDYDGLRHLRVRVPNLPLTAEEQQRPVLQPGLLQQGSVGENGGGGTPALRREAQPGITGEDEGDWNCARPEEPRQGESSVQRLLVQPGLSPDQHTGTFGQGAGTGAEHDCQGQAGDTRASAGNGDETGQAIAAKGIGAPYQRSEGRQSPGELDTDGQCCAQDGAPCSYQGDARPAQGKRTLEILACHVPPAWRSYFVETGEAVRMGAALALDQQSGTTTSGTGAKKGASSRGYRPSAYGAESRPKGTLCVEYGDSGGVSRFFYCAKASRSEREAGLQSLPSRRFAHSGGANGAIDAGVEYEAAQGIGLNRVSEVKNHHSTVKPLELMRWLVRLTTFPGQLVLDPFAGSGTTALACQREGRPWIGIELNPEYIEIGNRRIAAVQRDIQTTTTPLFDD